MGVHRHLRAAAQRFNLHLLTSDQYYERENIAQLQSIERAINRNGHSFLKFDSILDFACGNGRLTQYLPSLFPQAKIFGCDIDRDSIEQAHSRCPSGIFKTNGIQPTLEYKDEQFDFIYSYSVFTSLSETSHQGWLKELARVLRPGGVMLHTTHSYENIQRLAVFSPHILEQFDLPEPVAEFVQACRGYYYVPYSPETPDYGLAIISTEYVAKKWPEYTGLDLVEHKVAAIENYPFGPQDFVILAKPDRT